jgi:hypothetical protein
MDAFGKYYIHLPVAIHVISSKGGIPKIWGETLLLLLLGIDIDLLDRPS